MYPDTSGRVPMSINGGYCAGQFSSAQVDGTSNNLLGDGGVINAVMAMVPFTN